MLYYVDASNVIISNNHDSKYKFEKDQKLCIGSKLLQKYVCKKHGLQDKPIIKKNMFGKPYCSNLNQQIYYNVSHDYPYVIICVSKYNEVGIDIMNTKRNIPGIFKSIFTKEEKENIEQYPYKSIQYNDMYWKSWCAKEAFFKMIGTGLSNNIINETTINLDNIQFGNINNHMFAVSGCSDIKIQELTTDMIEYNYK